MKAERWQQVKLVFDEALELTPEDRGDFLDRVCSTDQFLREDVESLLASHHQAGPEFLGTGCTWTFGSEKEQQFRLQPGKRIAAYEIVEELAVGGMGAVYRAIRADGQYRQQVALKIVRAELGGQSGASRFRNERQILARLDHPNIAKILDGGTTSDGIPFFAMQLIDGLPITRYCDQRKLSIDDRLRMFRIVCSAVHYAHQHLVIHRDIKPSNILVTPEGIPKLLDFGIAKILDPDLLPENMTMTRTGMWLMTPEYASPEQLRNVAITTATDVYALGLVLYELLTGSRAYHLASRMPHEIARAILEVDPEKPSAAVLHRLPTQQREPEHKSVAIEQVCNLRGVSPQALRRRLLGDLDNIVLKALSKEPRERYNSVDQFSDDIRRHLERMPVLARKSTVAYRCRKYALRHKAGVLAATLVILSLMSGLALTLQQARIARANQLRAERSLEQTRELTQSLIGDFSNAIGNGVTTARVLMDQKAVAYLEPLVREENKNPQLIIALARAYLRLGEALGNPGLGHMGDMRQAKENYERAINLFQGVFSTDPNNIELRLYLREAYTQKALILGWTDIATALQVHLNALEIMPGRGPEYDFLAENSRGFEYDILAQVYGDPNFPNLGDTPRALDYIQKAVSIAEKCYRTDPQSDYSIHLYYASTATMADLLWARGQTREALKRQQQAEAILHSNSSSSPSMKSDSTSDWGPQSQVVREEKAMAAVRRAYLLAETGQLTSAQDALRESRAVLETLLSTDPLNYALRRDLTRNYNLAAGLLTRTGHFQAALDMYRRALPLTSEVLKRQPDQPDVEQHLADTYEGMGLTLARIGKTSEALEVSRKAQSIRESLAKLDRNNARYQFSLAKNDVGFGDISMKANHRAQAFENYRRALSIQKALASMDPYNALVGRGLADTQARLRTAAMVRSSPR